MLPSLIGRTRRLAGKAWRRAKRLGLKPGEAPVILMYHRVANPAFDPWNLCVSPDRFRQQIEMIKAERTPLSMDDLVAGLEQGDVPRFATAITFDDGYTDNALVAKPILDEIGVPATLFLTTGFVGKDRLYWWDELAFLVLATPEAADFDIQVHGVRLHGRWPEQTELPTSLQTWRALEPTDDLRQAAYYRLWSTVRELAPAKREDAIACLRELLCASGECPVGQMDRPMTCDMVRTFTSGMTGLGGHGRSHAPLTTLPPQERWDEISGGRADVADMTGRQPPSGLAFPHGISDEETRRMVREAGYSWAVTTQYEVVDRRRFDKYKLPRLGTEDWTAEELAGAIAGIGG